MSTVLQVLLAVVLIPGIIGLIIGWTIGKVAKRLGAPASPQVKSGRVVILNLMNSGILTPEQAFDHLTSSIHSFKLLTEIERGRKRRKGEE